VRLSEDLARCDRIVLPGGESTTMIKLLDRAELWEPLRDFGRSHPVWGICAGAILIASEVCSPAQKSLELISVRATRNYYGSQLDSFKAEIEIAGFDHKMHADFIRAPLLQPLEESVQVLADYNNQPVLMRQGRVLVSAFHTELGSDARLHEYFLGI